MELGIGLQLLILAAIVLVVVAWAKIFGKAGQPGWAAVVPFYNFHVALKMVGRPGWWLAMAFIPGVNIVVAIMLAVDVAKAFGRDGGFAVVLTLLPFVGFPMLAYGARPYAQPYAQPYPPRYAYPPPQQPQAYPQQYPQPQGYPAQQQYPPRY